MVFAGICAVIVSLGECALGLLLAGDAVSNGETNRAGALFHLINRMDGAKMLVLAALALAGAGLARRGVLSHWLGYVAGPLAAAMIASGIGYLLLNNTLAQAAAVSCRWCSGYARWCWWLRAVALVIPQALGRMWLGSWTRRVTSSARCRWVDAQPEWRRRPMARRGRPTLSATPLSRSPLRARGRHSSHRPGSDRGGGGRRAVPRVGRPVEPEPATYPQAMVNPALGFRPSVCAWPLSLTTK